MGVPKTPQYKHQLKNQRDPPTGFNRDEDEHNAKQKAASSKRLSIIWYYLYIFLEDIKYSIIYQYKC